MERSTEDERPDGCHDAEYAERMAADDRRALDLVYREHKDQVYTLVLRLVGPEAALDVTHDAFLRAYDRADDFAGRGSLGGWIAGIARNLALKHLRRERRRRDRSWSFPSGQRPRPMLSEMVDLERAIQRLPDTLRSVLVLHAVEGRPHREVAGLLGISEDASRKRLELGAVEEVWFESVGRFRSRGGS